MALGVIAVACALAIPAIYNRFPLTFPDTSVYLQVAFNDAWALDRSGYYGLAFRPLVLLFPAVTALWVSLALQLCLISACLLLLVKRVIPEAPLATRVSLIVGVAAVSTLPWHAAQLMPDAFAGPLVIVTWMAASRDTQLSGTPFLWFVAAAMALLHYTFLALMPAVALVTLGMAWWFGVPAAKVAKRFVVLLLCVTTIASAHVAVHGLKFGRWSVSPLGSVFLFARLNEDGLIEPWLDRHCGKDAAEPLCEIRNSIPRNSQVILWGGPRSPFYDRINLQAGEPASWPWVDYLGQAAIGSIREQPIGFAKTSLANAASQFTRFAALDDECPSECRMDELGTAYPALRRALDNSRQLRNEIPRTPIQIITSTVAIVCLASLPLLLLFAIRRKDRTLVSLVIAVVVALMVNAFLTGALSDVHDRYQSRLVWLAPLVAASALLRWVRWGRVSVTDHRKREAEPLTSA